MAQPAALVAGIPRQPIPFGLFSVFAPRPEGDGYWQGGNGITWETMRCDDLDGLGADHCDPETPTIGVPKNLDGANGPMGEASPFSVTGHWSCTPVGNDFAVAYQKAVDLLVNGEEHRVEQAFWTGDLGNVPNLSGANGYPAPTALGAAADAREALARVEDALARGYGSLGVIHMSRYTASVLKNDLARSGGRLTTLLGTPVVAGAGYPDVKTIVGTPALMGYRSEIFGPGRTVFDPRYNDAIALAERTYVLGFDPCGLVAATYTDPVAG